MLGDGRGRTSIRHCHGDRSLMCRNQVTALSRTTALPALGTLGHT